MHDGAISQSMIQVSMRPARPLFTRLPGLPAPCLLAGLLVCTAWATETTVPAPAETVIEDLSTAQLEQRLKDIDTELDNLARYSLRSGYGTIGWRSNVHDTPDHTEWVQIDLGEEYPIDQLILVPSLMRNAATGYESEGFPSSFRVIAGSKQHPEGVVLESVHANEGMLPRQAPVIVDCGRTKASWIRIEATRLSPRSWDSKYLFQLSETLVFSGQRNIALGRPVKVSSDMKSTASSANDLVDGFMPYMMDAAHGEQSLAFLASIRPDHTTSFTIDLGAPQPLDRIHLHSVDVSDSVPQPLPGDHGLPGQLLVMGANRADFTDAKLILNYIKTSSYDTGPIIARNIPVTTCRYVKLTAQKPYIVPFRSKAMPGNRLTARIGFAEIEFFAGDQNVALHRPVRANVQQSSDRFLTALTDGKNQFGNILPIRTWMEQLARRHDLETERPLIAQALNERYLRQKTLLTQLAWLTVLLAACIIIAILIGRISSMRQVAEIRQRLAADLHDELGANFHTIGLLGDVAMNAMHSPDRLEDVLQRNKAVTARTGKAIRHFISLQEAHSSPGTLQKDMQRIAQRILADIDYQIEVKDLGYLDKLKPITRDDLRLFFKESLVNISRHADATMVSASLIARSKQLILTICDNGRGMAQAEQPGSNSKVPASLRRRAQLLRAKVSISPSESGGTCVTLTLKIPWRQRVQHEKKHSPS